MSSPLFPGQIPLPPEYPAVAVPAQPQAPLATSAQPYDAATLAYYNAYYAQYNQYMAAMSAGAAAAPGSAWPVTGTVPFTYPCAPAANPLLTQPVTGWPVAAAPAAVAPSAAVAESASGEAGDDDDEDTTVVDNNHKRNVLPVHGNEKTMNLNSLILTNIQQSNYFRNTLYSIKTFNELIDEIWENVKHCEPWERSSRKVGNPTGMCGSVRGVGSGGIISTAFCCLYKLLTLKPTRKQIMTMIKYKDAPFIRAIGLLYVRYTQPPDQQWNWFSKFLGDEEEFCPASVAGSSAGRRITIGEMCRQMLTKQDWFSALFPRIPIPIQKEIDACLQEYDQEHQYQQKFDNYDEEGREERPSRKASPERRSDGKHRDRERDHRNQRRDRSRSEERRGKKRDRSRSRDRSFTKHSSSSSSRRW